MAKAPTPGVGKQKAAEAHARRVLTITVSDETVEFCPDNIPFAERMAIRKYTTLGYESFWGPGSIVDLDAFRVLWWLGKRLNGDRRYTFEESIRDVEAAFETDDYTAELTDPDAPEEATDNPES